MALYIGETGRFLRTRFGEHRSMLSLAMMLTNLLPNILIVTMTVSRIRKFEPSVPFLVAMTAAKDTKCASFPNLALDFELNKTKNKAKNKMALDFELNKTKNLKTNW